MINTTCTLTTACFRPNNSAHVAKTLQDALDAANSLMAIPIYLVIYGDSETIPLLKEKRAQYGHTDKTVFNEINKMDMWSFQYLDQVNKNREIYHPTKNERHNAEIHLINCNKSDFVLQTINRNPFNTTHFGWTDAFLGKDTVRICEDYNITVLPTILNRISAMDEKYHIQVINGRDKKYKLPENKREYYSEYQWVVSGGFFVCGAEIGCKILTRLKEHFVETTNMGYGHGDEMLYLEILDEFYDDITRSYGDYEQLWDNFVEPVRDVHYIYWAIIHKMRDLGQHRELYDCGIAVLNSILKHSKYGKVDEETLDQFKIPKHIYIDIVDSTRTAAQHYKPEMVRHFAKYLM